MAEPVEHGYPGPQSARCTVCGEFSWLCPHPWELREAGARWEAFARDMPWPPTRVVKEREAAAEAARLKAESDAAEAAKLEAAKP